MKELVDQVIRAWAAKDLGPISAAISDDCTWEMPAELPVVGGVHRGREAVLRLFEQTWALFPGWEPEAERFDVLGDQVVVRGTMYDRGGSGADIRYRGFFTVRDGRVAQYRAQLDSTDVLRAMDVVARRGEQAAGS